jgi:hypothetical protein
MKRVFLSSALILTCTVVWSQIQTKFAEFVNTFPSCNYPFIMSFDFSIRTKIDHYVHPTDEDLLKTFVYGQGIKPVALGCELKDFVAYDSYFQFPDTDSVVVVVLSPDMRDPACGDGSLLATYSKHNYQLQDALWISMRGGLTPQYIDDHKVVCNLDIESVIAEDSIYIERKETHSLRLNNVPRGQSRSRKLKKTTYKITYKMTAGGKFIKIREDRNDEILDPVANKLKEPLIREYE